MNTPLVSSAAPGRVTRQPPDQGSLEILAELVTPITSELFGNNGLPLVFDGRDEPEESAQEMVGIIGFTGTEMTGNLMISTSRDIVERSNPLPTEQGIAGEVALRDWVGELSNQLLGRLKNKLLRYGATLEMSPPVTLYGVRVHCVIPRSPDAKPFVFSSSSGDRVLIWFDALFEPGFKLDADAEGEACQEEGDLLLF